MSSILKVKTAVVGCGMISKIYLTNLTGLFSIIEVAALCDMDMQAAQNRADEYKIGQVMTLDEICASADIELVINLTGPAAHYSVIKQLLMAGKHVYTEKMLCSQFEQGRELVELAAAKGLYLGVAPDIFLGAGLQTARKVLDSGLIGKTTSCFAAVNRNQAINSEIFKYIRFKGGSLPYDVGVYYISALVSLLGPVKSVVGIAKEAPVHQGRLLYKDGYQESWQLAGNNLQAGVLEFGGGVVCSVHFDGTSIDEEQPFFTIYGTEGILKLGNPDHFDGEVILKRSGEAEARIPFTHGFKGTPVYSEREEDLTGGHRGVGAAELAWSIRLGRENRANKDMGLHILEIIAGIDISSREGREYRMTTTCERPAPLPSGYLAEELGGYIRTDAEISLTM